MKGLGSSGSRSPSWSGWRPAQELPVKHWYSQVSPLNFAALCAAFVHDRIPSMSFSSFTPLFQNGVCACSGDTKVPRPNLLRQRSFLNPSGLLTGTRSILCRSKHSPIICSLQQEPLQREEKVEIQTEPTFSWCVVRFRHHGGQKGPRGACTRGVCCSFFEGLSKFGVICLKSKAGT